MSDEIKFGYPTGSTLTYGAYQPDGTVRTAAGTSLPETAGTGYYHATDANIQNGDIVIVKEGTAIVGSGEYQPEVVIAFDNIHTWNVAKTGSDTNDGRTFEKAKLTIGAAVTAAATGDTIIIWPGTYDENVDLDAANKGLILIGTHRDLCIISPAADNGIEMESDSQLHNLSIIAGGNYKGVNSTSKNNLIIDNCYVYGIIDGIYLSGGNNARITNTHSKSTWDGALLTGTGLFVDNCIFETDGAYTGASVDGLVLGSVNFDAAGRIIRNSVILAVRVASSAQPVYGLAVGKGNVVLENCILVAVTKTDATGSVQALRAWHAATSSELAIKNCTFYSSSNGGTALDIYANKTSKITLLNCMYDRDKVLLADTAKVTDLSDANGRVDITKVKGVDATPMSKAQSTIVIGTVVADAGNNSTQFKTGLTEATDDHYKGRIVIFTSGSLKDQSTDITGYAGGTKIITVTAMTETPAADDAFVIV